MAKITDRKTFVRLLTDYGFWLQSTGKHDKYTNGIKTVSIPGKHSKGFCRHLAERIIREIKCQ